MRHAQGASSNRENGSGVSVKVTVTKPLPTGRQAFRLGAKGNVPARRSACVSARRRELLKRKDVTE